MAYPLFFLLEVNYEFKKLGVQFQSHDCTLWIATNVYEIIQKVSLLSVPISSITLLS